MQIHTVCAEKRKNSGKPEQTFFLCINPATGHNSYIVKDQTIASMPNALQPIFHRFSRRDGFQIMLRILPHICNQKRGNKTHFQLQTSGNFLFADKFYLSARKKTNRQPPIAKCLIDQTAKNSFGFSPRIILIKSFLYLFQSDFQHFRNIGNRNDFHTFLYIVWNFRQIFFIFRRNNHGFNASAQSCKQFFL